MHAAWSVRWSPYLVLNLRICFNLMKRKLLKKKFHFLERKVWWPLNLKVSTRGDDVVNTLFTTQKSIRRWWGLFFDPCTAKQWTVLSKSWHFKSILKTGTWNRFDSCLQCCFVEGGFGSDTIQSALLVMRSF